MTVNRLACSIAASLGCALVIGSAGCTFDVHVILPGPGTGLGDDGLDDDGLDDTGGHEGSEHDDPSPNPALDIGDSEGFAERSCKVADADLDAPLPCERRSPSSMINPTVAWTWTGPGGQDSVLVTPLVANLDDDNGDGQVDACDTPDIVVIAVDLPPNKADPLPPGRLYVLDSITGAAKFVIDHPIDATATPAIADLDGDGTPELIALERSATLEPGQLSERRVVAFAADGSLVWQADTTVLSLGGGGLAIADLDADGSPEILAPEHVLSADGELLWVPPQAPLANSIPIAADLDLDGDLEVVFGSSVYAHDGALLFELPLLGGKNIGVAAIANFDDDPYPEIYVQSVNHRILEHDGSLKAVCPGGSGRPVAIVDLDGDGKAEILFAQGGWFRVLAVGNDNCTPIWSAKIEDLDASASGTAFDFLAGGTAQPVFADRNAVRWFDHTGETIAVVPRTARSATAIPVVVDADNDGAADVILVGSAPLGGDTQGVARPSVLLVHNADDRFAPTRRIWNQHAYHGTNIREDGRVPVEQPPHWLESNRFRANTAPGYAGDLCQPPAID